MNGRTNASSTTNGILQVPLDPPTLFVAEGSHEKISLSWTDPKTKYATPEGEIAEEPDQVVATWDHTVIVRKTDGYPATPNDGIVVISSGQYNQYQSSPYVDTGLTNQTQYYYAAFAFNSDGIPSEPAHVECFLYGYDEVFANNSWEYISRAGEEGVHTSLWEIGDEKPLDIGDETFTMQIIGFDHDDLADGSGKAPITLCSKEVSKYSFKAGTVSSGSGPAIAYNSALWTAINQLYSKIDSNTRSLIKNITKSFCMYYRNSTSVSNSGSRTVTVFTLGISELYYTSQQKFIDAGEGTRYQYFSTASTNKRIWPDSFIGDSTNNCLLRTMRHRTGTDSTGYFKVNEIMYMTSDGSVSTDNALSQRYAASNQSTTMLAFCM